MSDRMLQSKVSTLEYDIIKERVHIQTIDFTICYILLYEKMIWSLVIMNTTINNTTEKIAVNAATEGLKFCWKRTISESPESLFTYRPRYKIKYLLKDIKSSK